MKLTTPIPCFTGIDHTHAHTNFAHEAATFLSMTLNYIKLVLLLRVLDKVTGNNDFFVLIAVW